MTTPTPRTDAAEFFATTSDDAIYCVSAAFARQLERDLATAQSELASVKAEREGLRRIIRMAAAYGNDHFHPYIHSYSGSMIHVAEVLDFKEGA